MRTGWTYALEYIGCCYIGEGTQPLPNALRNPIETKQEGGRGLEKGIWKEQSAKVIKEVVKLESRMMGNYKVLGRAGSHRGLELTLHILSLLV